MPTSSLHLPPSFPSYLHLVRQPPSLATMDVLLKTSSAWHKHHEIATASTQPFSTLSTPFFARRPPPTRLTGRMPSPFKNSCRGRKLVHLQNYFRSDCRLHRQTPHILASPSLIKAQHSLGERCAPPQAHGPTKMAITDWRIVHCPPPTSPPRQP